MKKLGIFGDSYGEIKPSWFPGYNTGWSYRLHQEYNGECDVHAGAGSSHPYNFRQFLEHHTKYDQIIFIVTNLHRLSLPVNATDKRTGKLVQLEHFPNVNHVEYVIKNFDVENNIARKILDYFVYISQPLAQHIKDSHMATVSYIRQVRSDAIIIPAFSDCGITTEYNWSLCDIDSNETAAWYTNRGIEHWVDPRINHFTPPTQNWIIEHMKGRLRGEFIDWNPSLTPSYKTKAEFDASLSSFTN
jgi:hypothetical protein